MRNSQGPSGTAREAPSLGVQPAAPPPRSDGGPSPQSGGAGAAPAPGAAEVYTLDDLVRCVGRELGLRRNVMPKWVKAGRMTDAAAKKEIGCMAQIYEMLKQQQRETTS